MTETERMPRYTPPTPRSRRLGKELRRLRDAAGLTLDDAGREIGCSPSRISRIESGEIKSRPGDVMEILTAYKLPLDSEQALALLAVARDLRQPGWWQRLDTLPSRYITYLQYEGEASELRHFEPTLVPGLLQTEAYARAIVSIGRETDSEAIEQRVKARMTRQAVLTRERPLRLWAVISEAVLHTEVGSPEVQREQLQHLVKIGTLPTVVVQVLPFTAGGHLALHGGFSVLSFEKGESDLGYAETPAGELFLELPADIKRLVNIHDHLKTLSLSPADSAKLIKEMSK